jgi:hypothetical protein
VSAEYERLDNFKCRTAYTIGINGGNWIRNGAVDYVMQAAPLVRSGVHAARSISFNVEQAGGEIYEQVRCAMASCWRNSTASSWTAAAVRLVPESCSRECALQARQLFHKSLNCVATRRS